jgi:hypothetical protein
LRTIIPDPANPALTIFIHQDDVDRLVRLGDLSRDQQRITLRGDALRFSIEAAEPLVFTWLDNERVHVHICSPIRTIGSSARVESKKQAGRLNAGHLRKK